MKVIGVEFEEVRDQDWKGFEYTGEIISIEFPDAILGTVTNKYRVVKGKFTPFYGVRDCGDHYIMAQYSSYVRIEKGTFEITKNVEDE